MNLDGVDLVEVNLNNICFKDCILIYLCIEDVIMFISI